MYVIRHTHDKCLIIGLFPFCQCICPLTTGGQGNNGTTGKMPPDASAAQRTSGKKEKKNEHTGSRPTLKTVDAKGNAEKASFVLKAKRSIGQAPAIYLIVLVIFASTAYQIGHIQKTWPRFDSQEYLILAHNLVSANTFSLDRHPEGKPQPTAYRMPGYPLFLAAVYCLTWWHIPKDVNTLLHAKKTAFTFATILIFELTLLLAAIMTAKLTTNKYLALVPPLALGFYSPFLQELNWFFPEYLIAAWLLIASAIFYRAMAGKKQGPFFLTGLVMGALALTRAPFAYLSPILIIAILLSWKHLGSLKHALVSSGLLLLGFFIILSPWLIRNRAVLGAAILAERGAGTMEVRTLMDNMNKSERLQALYAGTPSLPARRLIARIAAHPEWNQYRDTRRLDPFFKYERIAKNTLRRQKMTSPGLTGPQLDQQLRQTLIKKWLAHPWKHIQSIPLFFYRGIQQYNSILLNLLLFGALLAQFILSLTRKKLHEAAFYLPAIFLIAFLSTFTFNEPRYIRPALPIAWMATVQLAAILFRKQAPLNSQSTEFNNHLHKSINQSNPKRRES